MEWGPGGGGEVAGAKDHQGLPAPLHAGWEEGLEIESLEGEGSVEVEGKRGRC